MTQADRLGIRERVAVLYQQQSTGRNPFFYRERDWLDEAHPHY
jgi:hypothetical protein